MNCSIETVRIYSDKTRVIFVFGGMVLPAWFGSLLVLEMEVRLHTVRATDFLEDSTRLLASGLHT